MNVIETKNEFVLIQLKLTFNQLFELIESSQSRRAKALLLVRKSFDKTSSDLNNNHFVLCSPIKKSPCVCGA